MLETINKIISSNFIVKKEYEQGQSKRVVVERLTCTWLTHDRPGFDPQHFIWFPEPRKISEHIARSDPSITMRGPKTKKKQEKKSPLVTKNRNVSKQIEVKSELYWKATI